METLQQSEHTHFQNDLFSFQTLYSLLPVLLESNPFKSKRLDNSITKTEPLIPNMDDILSVFQKALDMFTECHLHPQITSQLFCYLFYFTSTTVFNSMMTKGTYEDTIFFFVIFTARVRSTREGNIYTWKFLSVYFGGGVPHPYPSPSLSITVQGGGGYPIQPWMGGVPQPWTGGVP